MAEYADDDWSSADEESLHRPPDEFAALSAPTMFGEIKRLEQQRDELLIALEGVLPFLTGEYWPGTVADAAVDFAVATARKVAANVKDKT